MPITLLNIILFTQNNSHPKNPSLLSTVHFFQISISKMVFSETLKKRPVQGWGDMTYSSNLGNAAR